MEWTGGRSGQLFGFIQSGLQMEKRRGYIAKKPNNLNFETWVLALGFKFMDFEIVFVQIDNLCSDHFGRPGADEFLTQKSET